MSLRAKKGDTEHREFRGPSHVRNGNGPPQLHKRSLGQAEMQPANVVLRMHDGPFFRFLPEDVRMQRHIPNMPNVVDCHSSAASERSLPSLCGSPMPPLEAGGLPPLPPLPSPEPSLSPPPTPPQHKSRQTPGHSFKVSISQRDESKETERKSSTDRAREYRHQPKVKQDPAPSTKPTKLQPPSRPHAQAKPFRLHPTPTTGLSFGPPNLPETQSSIQSSKKKKKTKHGGMSSQAHGKASPQLQTTILRGLSHMNRVLAQMRDEIVRNRSDWRQEVVVLKQRVSKLSNRMTRLEKHNAILRKRHQMMQYKQRKQIDTSDFSPQQPITYVTTQASHFAVPAGTITFAPSSIRALPIHHAPPPLSPGDSSPITPQNFYVSDRTSPGDASVSSGTPSRSIHAMAGLISPMSSMELDQLDGDSDSMFD